MERGDRSVHDGARRLERGVAAVLLCGGVHKRAQAVAALASATPVEVLPAAANAVQGSTQVISTLIGGPSPWGPALR
nr:unnamed protein product [Digitaria exilis]